MAAMDVEGAAQAAAAVLRQALGFADDVADLVATFTPLSNEAPLVAWTVELSANGEPIAFLVHAYDLAADSFGLRQLAADLAEMERAAEHGLPGPRVVAQAKAGGWGVVIATSPAALARLTGSPSAAAAAAPASSIERERAADGLLQALRAADKRAAAFLAAVGDGSAAATTAERALALFIADGPSLANLGRALTVAVERGRTGQDDAAPGPR